MRKAEVSHRCDVIDVRMSYRIELYKNTLLKIPHRSILLQTVILKAEAVMELLKDGNGKSDTTMPPPPHIVSIRFIHVVWCSSLGCALCLPAALYHVAL